MIRFLGSVQLALLLISTTTMFVITGTVLESITDSHQYAAFFTYDNPLFTALLGFYFINILVSALRRWPFKLRHLPFLITHMGLLMILTGVIIKNIWGTQGYVILWEGNGSSEIIDSRQEVIEIEDRDTKKKIQYPLKSLPVIRKFDHSVPIWRRWIFDNQLRIIGQAPIPLNQKTPYLSKQSQNDSWVLFATKSNTPESFFHRIYQEHVQAEIFLLKEKKHIKNVDYQFVDLNHILASYGEQEVMVNLTDLSQKSITAPHIGSVPFEVRLSCEPIAIFIQDDGGNTHISCIDSWGRITFEKHPVDRWDSLIIFDDGFAGYAAKTTLPVNIKPQTRSEKIQELEKILNEATPPLAEPLEMMRKACLKNGSNFGYTCLKFLEEWADAFTWLAPSTLSCEALNFLEWNEASRKAASWVTWLTLSVDERIREGVSLEDALVDIGWPVPAHSMEEFSAQIFSISNRLPDQKNSFTEAELLSAFFRAYGIYLTQILPENPLAEVAGLQIESPMEIDYKPLPPSRKIEDNLPALELHYGSEKIMLGFDPIGMGLKQPITTGKKLLQYRHFSKKIPHHIRICQARQINYPNSSQPYSYECDVVIDHDEVTLSMNEIHETWDGYRYYLAAISPGTEGEVQQVRIVVNHDPAKYWLTYPGAFVLTIGTILVFWFYNKRK